jgi:hypothetical protein
MDMGIHQTRHHRAAAEINDLGARIGALANILVGPDCENSSIPDRDGLKDRRGVVERDDLPVDQNHIGGGRLSVGGCNPCRQGQRRDKHETIRHR